MRMNVEKTDVLTVSRQQEVEMDIMVEGRQVKNKTKFKYLGSVIAAEGVNGQDIT